MRNTDAVSVLHVPITSTSGNLSLLKTFEPVISLYRDYFNFR